VDFSFFAAVDTASKPMKARTPFLHQQQSLTIKLSKTPVFSGIYGV
jgi:hypothetical protein